MPLKPLAALEVESHQKMSKKVERGSTKDATNRKILHSQKQTMLGIIWPKRKKKMEAVNLKVTDKQELLSGLAELGGKRM